MELHKLLQRQVKKFLGSKDWGSDEQMVKFLQAVGESYKNYESDQALSERAFNLADAEYYEITQKLFDQKKLRDKSIDNLLKTIQQLEEGSGNEWIQDSSDILNITEYLDRQVKQRKAAEKKLKKAIKISESAAKAKTEFLSTMSHEIRSPLNVIIGTTHVLKLEDHLETQEENLEVLDIASKSLMLLINDILDYNKIEAGKLEIESMSMDIKELIADIKKANSANAEEKGNRLTALIDSDIPDYLMGDSVRIGQVITNLVSNAVKFTDHGSIQIMLSLLKKEGDQCTIRVEVTDTGIGIAKESQEKILEEFTQAGSSVTRKFGGTGLGLAISKKLLQLMNSTVQIDSTPGKGSNFFFDLTVKEGEPFQKSTGRDSEARDLDGARILAVDDLKTNLVLLKKILGEWNVDLDTCSDGEEAIDKVRRNEYDLILMDVQMPVMDGKEATIQIRKFNKDIPVIAFSALYDENFRKDLLDAGMNDFIAKPFNPDEMYLKLKRFLQKFRNQSPG